MNIFVLNTGRCGSTTFIEACKHISNFSSAHESRSKLLGEDRLNYPNNHIEADNRLSWVLGRLDKVYGNDAVYIHLKRDDNATARSFVKRFSKGIIKSYKDGVLMGSLDQDAPSNDAPMSVALDYCDTVNSNIELFLKDKTQKMNFSLENSQEDFPKFWQLIGAEGNLEAALAEFSTCYNASNNNKAKPTLLRRISRKVKGTLVKGK
ncbi:MAG: hypothetical protein WBG70_11615 [Spirulinaceae cyanobacterium]